MKMRKGFTLVELLIVIVIIGILAAAMLLSTGSATASAKASNVISDLRSMKSACLLLYADSMDDFDLGTVDFSTLKPSEALKKYVDNPEKYNSNYKFALTAGKWYVGYTINPKDAGGAEIKAKLAGKAKSVGLLGAANTANIYDGLGNTVYMVAR